MSPIALGRSYRARSASAPCRSVADQTASTAQSAGHFVRPPTSAITSAAGLRPDASPPPGSPAQAARGVAAALASCRSAPGFARLRYSETRLGALTAALTEPP